MLQWIRKKTGKTFIPAFGLKRPAQPIITSGLEVEKVINIVGKAGFGLQVLIGGSFYGNYSPGGYGEQYYKIKVLAYVYRPYIHQATCKINHHEKRHTLECYQPFKKTLLTNRKYSEDKCVS